MTAVAMALLQFLVGAGLPQAGAVMASKTALLVLYLAIAVALFRQEAMLVAVKVANKFSRK